MHALARLGAAALIAASVHAAAPRRESPAAIHASRRAAALARLGSDLLIVPSRASFGEADQPGFTQAPNFQYLTGFEDLVGAVLVVDGASGRSTLFVPSSTAVAVSFEQVEPIAHLDPWLRNRFAGTPGVVAYVASADTRGAVDAPAPMARTVVRWQAWLSTLGVAEVKAATSILGPLREIKDDGELAILRRVGAASRDAALAAIRRIVPGVWEHDTELAVVNACRAAGARGVSFWPWTFSGPNALPTSMRKSFVAYDHLDRTMKGGELVRVDVGCQIDHYMGDVGRTVPVSGRFTDGQREAWDLFVGGYRAGLPRIADGASAASVYDAALADIRQRATSLKTAQGRRAAEFLQGPQGKDLWAIHGVGLSDAEGAPDVLRAGMVVAYELMFVVDGDAFYLEDMIAVTRGGHELLTRALPYTADEIERVMSKRIR